MTNTVPAAAAARAAASSPSRCTRRARPAGPQMKGHLEAPAQHRDARVPLGDVHQRPGSESDPVERLVVGPQRDLAIGAALHEVVQQAGQPAPGQAAEVVVGVWREWGAAAAAPDGQTR